VKLRTLVAAVLGTAGAVWALDASLQDRVRELELAGEARQARQLLEDALHAAPGDADVLEYAAHFADTRRDAEAVALYQRLADLPGLAVPRRQAALRRLIQLELAAGNRPAATARLADLMNTGVPAPELPQTPQPVFPMGYVEVPGPVRSFSRMAALSPDTAPDELLLSLARNIVTNGYQAISGTETFDQTEYLKLVLRYLSQARELDKFSGSGKVIRIETCDSEKTGELLKILGFRMRGGCGGDVVLETVNASRAFLAMDSGFPLAQLEQALRTNRPFEHDFKPTRIAVIFGSEYWLSVREKQAGEFIDAFLNDPSMCRLYLGLAKLDPETAADVRRAMPLQRIRAFAHVFDFFGGMFRIRNGVATVPGGARSAGAWAELAGVAPDQGAAFLEKIVTRDDGWMASYFDSLSRISGPSLDYLTEPARLKRFYAAIRGKVTSPGPARPVFRANTEMMLLTTRLNVVDGQVRIPGDTAIWKTFFSQHPSGKIDLRLAKAAPGWSAPDDVIEALFGLTPQGRGQRGAENLPRAQRSGPPPPETAGAGHGRAVDARLQDLRRPTDAAQRSAGALRLRHPDYLDAARAIDSIKDNTLHADAAGIFQALAGLWQIWYRNHEVPSDKAEIALQAVIAPFQKPKENSREIFDAGRTGLAGLLAACGVEPKANPQDKTLDLLAGSLTPVRSRHTRPAGRGTEPGARGSEAGQPEDALRFRRSARKPRPGREVRHCAVEPARGPPLRPQSA
jgi:hypothetical protein